ncbi:uncharacterized protein LOC127093638 [Lathyrus oleraceus]|uniref:uncharacterized protein LOC127093638 n=1 Tax=Pisum sativum TaxID=3888 RepID=UPI0021D1304C|nr:uncharacterized protein LOC127093638 [Pisum sativum]
MPSYAKFLKEILSNKIKLEDDETSMLTAECNAIIQNNMPPKLKNSGSFSIPCVIGSYIIDKDLCDLGASVSLMPLSTCEKLNLGELRPTKMSLQLVDRFVKFPIGTLENVPVRIGQFYIPTDFVIMDIKDPHPYYFRKNLFSHSRSHHRREEIRLTFEVGEEKVKFLLAKFLQAPVIDYSCCFLDIIDECVKEIEKEPSKYTEVLKIPTPYIFEDDNCVSHT